MTKTQISTSVPPIIRQRADELVEEKYGTMSALLTALITTEYARYEEEIISIKITEAIEAGASPHYKDDYRKQAESAKE